MQPPPRHPPQNSEAPGRGDVGKLLQVAGVILSVGAACWPFVRPSDGFLFYPVLFGLLIFGAGRFVSSMDDS